MDGEPVRRLDIMLRDVTLFGQDHGDYPISLKILKDKDRSVLGTVAGNFTPQKKKMRAKNSTCIMMLCFV